ncbi:cobalt ECF transporter T component CbiQ [Candidatus Fermentibacteria bacterium]|nr:cobalt ECF transporter T component CbiQ [Candidatus Fermentibacteria bacterium]
MTTELDRFSHLDSVIHGWDPRTRIAGLFVFALAITRLSGTLLAVALAASMVVFALSRLPASYLVERVRWPGIFFAALAVLMPFIYGDRPLVVVGPLVLREEGLQLLLTTACRFLSIVVLGVTAFGTSRVTDSVRALRSLGVPAILADLMLFTYRFIHETGRELRGTRTAVKLRGFSLRKTGPRALRVISALIGSLLVRGWERSEEVMLAMRLRAYSPGGSRRAEGKPNLADFAGLVLCVIAAAAAVLAELRQGGG